VVLATMVAFVLVAGYAAAAWLRRGREPAFVDDRSVLMAAPPPEMTPATATIVDRGPTHLAFMAALLDLASRDEIAFEDERRGDGPARVGIAIHGGETADARDLLNRRRPAGAGETWLLAQLKMLALAARTIEARTGRQMTSPQLAQIRDWAARDVAQPQTPPRPEYIPAGTAIGLHAPILFGTFVQSHAVQHGWLVGLPLMRRLRWRLTAAGEIVVALIVASIGSILKSDVVGGLALGILAGGVATWMLAPAMTTTTLEGVQMKAELAAFRRTLQQTFGQSRSMEAALGASGFTWLETPDQALVWGVALGLCSDIEALLARTADDLRDGQPPNGTYAPAWYSVTAVPGSTSGTANGGATAAAMATKTSAMPAAGAGSAITCRSSRDVRGDRGDREPCGRSMTISRPCRTGSWV